VQAADLSPCPRQRGVTLIELIVTIVLLGIVSAVVSLILLPVFTANQSIEQRAELVESSLRRMAREIRIALPNSVRVSSTVTTFALEVIPTVDGGRYCIAGLANCAGAIQQLNFAAADTSFDILGCFRNAAFIAASGSNAYRLVIGDLDGSVYSSTVSPGVMTVAARTITIAVQPAGTCGVTAGSRHRITLSAPGHQFSNPSANERLYVIQANAVPVSYLCNSATGTLMRYSGYAMQAGQPTNPAALPLSAATSIAQISANISRCGVLGDTASVQSTGIVALQLGVASGSEAIELLHQVQLDNSL
jgi:MSHA biogenesis protein MshO